MYLRVKCFEMFGLGDIPALQICIYSYFPRPFSLVSPSYCSVQVNWSLRAALNPRNRKTPLKPPVKFHPSKDIDSILRTSKKPLSGSKLQLKHRISQVGRGPWGSLRPTPCSFQDYIKLNYEQYPDVPSMLTVSVVWPLPREACSSDWPFPNVQS